ncbi:ABC transporter permease [Anaeromicrobium sediminis]|nr:ABC transporter permease [Anaeromicrobium sediminis]
MKSKLIKILLILCFLITITFILSPILILFVTYIKRGIQEVNNPLVIDAIKVSFKSTSISLIIIIILGIPSAYILARENFYGKKIIDTLLELPLVLPPAVSGLLLLITFGRNGYIGKELYKFGVKLPFTFWAVVVAQIFVALPLFIKTVKSGILKVDRDLELAAATLGDKPWQVFMRITLPLSYVSIITGGILAWARALAEFGATIMFAGNLMGRTQTLPLAIYSAMEKGTDLSLSIAVILVFLSLLVLFIVKFGFKKYMT